jgi:uncharacterized Zn finger protein
MCKHVAAVLYGIGARLDRQPELLFRLHKVDEKELIAKAGNELPLSNKGPAAAKVLSGGEDLSALFGLDMAQNTKSTTEPADRAPSKPKRAQKAPVELKASTPTTVPKKKSGVKPASKTERRKLSPAASKRIAEVLRARWAARKKTAAQQASAKNPVSKKAVNKAAKQTNKKTVKKAAKKGAGRATKRGPNENVGKKS